MIRRLKTVAALATAATLVLSGCGGSDSGSGTPSAAPTDKVLHCRSCRIRASRRTRTSSTPARVCC